MNRPSRVVVVEDEEADIIFLTKAFERGAQEHQVTACRTGAEFFTHLEQCHDDEMPPDLVLLDLNLPVVSGSEILSRLRAGDHFPALIVIVFTSSAYRREISDVYAAGANAFVTKPARLSELDQLVRSVEEFWFTAGQPPYA